MLAKVVVSLWLVARLVAWPATTPERGNVPAVEPASIGGAAATDIVWTGRRVYLDEGCDICHGAPDAGIAAELAGLPRPPRGEAPIVPLGRVRRTMGWHARHLMDPASVSPGTIMPPYPHLTASSPDAAWRRRIRRETDAPGDWQAKYIEAARAVAASIGADGPTVPWDSALVALVAWLDTLAPP
jgi:cbb3-type cytochrome oxidase cytochrome c subunit